MNPSKSCAGLRASLVAALLALLCAFGFILIPEARAELLAWDDFSSIDDADNLASGEGWAAGWTVRSSLTGGVSVVTDDPISYLFDNGATIGGTNTLKIAASDNSVNDTLVRNLAIPVTDGRDIYVSFIFKIKSTVKADGESVSTSSVSWIARDASVNINNDTMGIVGLSGKVAARIKGATSSVNTVLKFGTTYFCIIKYYGWDSTNGTYRNCKVWLNPGSADEDLSTAAKTATQALGEGVTGGSDSFRGLQLRSYLLSAENYQLVAALRVGETWDDVLPEANADAFTVAEANENWIPLNHSLEIAPGGVFDFSGQGMVDAPAGKHGAIKATTGGRFEFENRPGVPVRFWGVNLVQDANYLTEAQADQLAERLARSGYNTVRIHHYDEYLVGNALSNGGNSYDIEYNAETKRRLAKLDYLFAALKKRGIYINIDLYSSRGFSAVETAAFGASSTSAAKNYFKALIPISDDALESWKKFATNLLTHVNPYTGIAWGADPALIGICPVNENQPHGNLSIEEVKVRYETIFDAITPPAGETAAGKKVRWNRFLYENSFTSNDAMYAHLRALGVKALITTANTTKASAMTILRSRYDYVDDHLYWDHPSFPENSWSLPINFSQASAMASSANVPGRMMPSRIFGKPFTSTEFHFSRPNRYRAESSLLMPAYASLQDWGALYNFDYAKDAASAMAGTADNYFAIANDPIGLIGDRIGSLLFQRGDIAPATTNIVYAVREEEAYSSDSKGNPGKEYDDSFRRIGLVTRVGSLPGNPGEVLASGDYNFAAAVVGSSPALSPLPEKTYVATADINLKLQNDGVIPAGSVSANGKIITSETRELQLDIDAGTFRVVTPRGEHFVLAPQSALAGDRVSVTNGTAFGAVTVVALKTADDADVPTLATARRILVTHLTDSLGTGMTFANPDRKQLTAWGALPHLVHKGGATLDITLSGGEWAAWDVDMTGARIRQRSLARIGETDTWRLEVSTAGAAETGAQFAYELARADFTPPASAVISNVSPFEVRPGDSITITGENLDGATVAIGGAPATITASGATSLTVTVPAGAADGSITVTTAAGSVVAAQQLTIETGASLPNNLLAYDEFDTYASGTGLHALSGGEGWGVNAWSAKAEVLVSSESVNYPLGNDAVRGGGNAIWLDGANVDPVISRKIANSITDGSDVYASFVFKIRSAIEGEADGASLPTSSHVFMAWTAVDAKYANTDTIGVVGFNGKVGARVNNAGSPALVSTVLKFGQPYLLVIKYIWDSEASVYKKCQVWLNPTADDESATNAAMTATQEGSSGGSSSFDGLRVRGYGVKDGRYHLVDSLRIGKTWASVVTQAAPAVTGVSPHSVSVDDLVTITGKNLFDAQVTIGGAAAAIVERTDASVKVRVPAGAADGTIVVTTAGGALTASETLTIIPSVPAEPVVTGVSPLAVHPGDSITITGENLAGATVTIGGVAATITGNTATSITVTVPEGASGGVISVATANGTATAAQELTITPVDPPPAGLLATEDFDSYTADAGLNALNDGTGWDGAGWSAKTGASVSSESITYMLDNGDVLGGGNSLKVAAEGDALFSRKLATPVNGGADVYASFIFTVKSTAEGEGDGTELPTGSNIFGAWQALDSGANNAVDSIGFVGLAGQAGARVNNQTKSLPSALRFGQTYFYVVKYIWDSGASAYRACQVWLNPNVGDELSESPGITAKITGDAGGSSAFLGLRVRTLGLKNGRYHLYDALRVGTTWADVVGEAPGVIPAGPKLVVFGDSLSSGGDDGIPLTSPTPTPANGGYPRRTWAQQFSEDAGYGVLMNGYPQRDGGTNYAKSGDATNDSGLTAQVDTYLADVASVSSSKNLYVLWLGTNDVSAAVNSNKSKILADPDSFISSVTAAMPAAAERMDAQIRRLIASGATRFLWVDLPDMGATPLADYYVGYHAGGDTAARPALASAMTGACAAFNARMDECIAVLKTEFPRVSFHAFSAAAVYGDIMASPGEYGFTNVTEGSLDSNEHFFRDRIHPTSHAHHEIARAALAVARTDGLLLAPFIGNIIIANETALAGDVVTIVGGGFSNLEKVLVGGIEAGIIASNTGLIKVALPGGAARDATVSVVTATGQKETSQPWNVVANGIPGMPAVTGISTLKAKPGDSITITGENLGGATVLIGGVVATITGNDAGSITVTVPDNASDGSIAISTIGGLAVAEEELVISSGDELPEGLLATDDFNDLISGKGWAAAWTVKTGVSVVSDEPITYLHDDGTTFGGGGVLKIAASDNNVIERKISNAVTNGDDVFVSFIFKIKKSGVEDGTQSSGSEFCAWIALDEDPSVNNDTQGVVNSSGRIAARVNDSSSTEAKGTKYLKYGETYFMVVKYTGWNAEASQYRKCQVWLNPATTDENSTDKAITVTKDKGATAGGASSFLGLQVRSYLLNDSTYHLVDNLRIGSSWAAVAGKSGVRVDSVSPGAAYWGDSITITGVNLDGATSVTIGGEEATVTENTGTSITVVVPEGAVDGTIVITTPKGTVSVDDLLDLTPSTNPFKGFIAADEFDTLAGGVGWIDDWTVKTNVSIISDEPITYELSENMTYGGGNAMKILAAGDVNSTLNRTLQNKVTDGKDVFVRMIFSVKSTNPENLGKALTGEIFTSWEAGYGQNGSKGTLGVIGSGGKIAARMGSSSSNETKINASIETGKTYLLVIKYAGWDGTAYRSCQVWLNPSLDDEGTTDSTKTAIKQDTGQGSTAFNGLAVRSWSTSAAKDNYYQVIDALRVADSWEAVMSDATPEPEVPDPDEFTVVRESEGWVRLNHSLDIAEGGVFDFAQQGLIDAPAGKHGAIKATADGHFAFENRPGENVRFWGVNLCFDAIYLDKTQADKVAERLARSGYNTVRIHHYDEYLVRDSISAGKNSWELDPVMLDKLDYLFHAMKTRGLYVNIDLFSGRNFSQAEADALGVDRSTLNNNYKALVHLNDTAFESWKKFARNLLTHVNPYTGMAWGEDPALIGICPINEDPTQEVYGKNAVVKEMYHARFLELHPDMAAKEKNSAERTFAFNKFIFDTNIAIDNKLRDFLKNELGVKALITGANYTISQGLAFVRSKYDYVDNHIYSDHPSGWSLPITFNQGNSTGSRAYVPSRIAPSRIFGKPFTVTEYHFSRPNRNRVEGALLMPAYASLQDWDGMYNFHYATSLASVTSGSADNYFSIANDPISLIGDRLGAFLFQRGDIKPAQRAIAYAVRESEAFTGGYVADTDTYNRKEFASDFRPLGLITRVGSLPGTPGEVLAANPDLDAIVIGTAESPMPAKTYRATASLLGNLKNDGIIPNSASVSDTGEIDLDPTAKTVRVVTERGEHFLLMPDSTLAGNRVSVANGDVLGVVSVTALKSADEIASASGVPTLGNAKRILVTHLTDSLTTGMSFNATNRKVLTKWGSLPHLVRNGSATLTFTLPPGDWTAYAVDMTGARTRAHALTRIGETNNWTMEVSTGGTAETGAQFAYELVRDGIVVPAPVVSTIAPRDVHPGDTITITGENLGGATITIGGVAAVVISNDGTTIIATVPEGTTGGSVSVNTGGGSVTADQELIITPAPVTDFFAADDFESYSANTALNSLNGGTGWDSAGWSAGAGATVSSESITYMFGNGEIRGGGNSLKIGTSADPLLSRKLTQSVTNGDDVYVSFIFKVKSTAAGDDDGGSLPDNGHIFAAWQALDGSPASTDTIGVIGFNGKVGARINNAGSPTLVPNTLKFGQTYFFVVKYTGWDGTAYRTAQVWLNPTADDANTTSTSITAKQTNTTAGGSSSFDGLRLRTFGVQNGRYHLVDDIRVGKTWEDVVGKPSGVTEVPITGSKIVAFGDSLSSGGPGNNPATGPNSTTAYPKLTWITQLSPMAGYGALVNNQVDSTGLNYAKGGDTTTDMVGKISSYLSACGNVSDPQNFYVLWCGGNDIGHAIKDNAIGLVLGTASVINTIKASGPAAAIRMEAQIERLAESGATVFYWVDLPNLANTPSVDHYLTTYGMGSSETMRARLIDVMQTAAQGFNTEMAAAIARLTTKYPGITIHTFSSWAFFDDIIANAATYGFDNVTSSATADGLGDLDKEAANKYLFWDNVHPTSHGHNLLATTILADWQAKNLVVTAPVPEITGLYSANANPAAGDIISITGLNFDPVTQVLFGDKPAEVLGYTATVIKARFPADATAGPVTVVTSPESNMTTWSGAWTNMELPAAPSVTSVSPVDAEVEPGNLITITGNNLAGIITISVGGKSATIGAGATDTELTFTLPDGAANGVVTLESLTGRYVVVQQLTLKAPPLIATEDFEDSIAGNLSGQNGGTGWDDGGWRVRSDLAAKMTIVTDAPITYTLDNGATRGGGNALKLAGSFDGEALSRKVAAKSQITTGKDVFVSFVFQVKDSTKTDGDEFKSGNIVSSWQAYDSNQSYTNDTLGLIGIGGRVEARVKNAGTAVSSYLKYGRTYFIVIKYTGWDGTAYRTSEVWLNPKTTEENTTLNSIKASKTNTEGGSTSFLGLGVRTNSLSDAKYQLIDDIRVGTTWEAVVGLPGPAITSIDPTTSAIGQTITITGEHLGDVTNITIDGIAASFTVVSDTTITVEIPDGARDGAITITSPSGSTTSAEGALTIVSAPVITTIDPASAGAGETITITGQNFGAVTGVTIGGQTAQFTVVSDTTLTVTIPEGTTSNEISIVSPGGTAASAEGALTIIPAPVITSFAPASVHLSGTVVITGTNYIAPLQVFVGSAEMGIVTSSGTSLAVTVPATATSEKITVKAKGGQITTTDLLTVIGMPTGASITPASAPVGGVITITGGNFTGATSVVIGGAAATFTFVSDTTITATVPEGAISGDVTVTTPSGMAAVGTIAIIPAPTVTSFAPTTAAIGGSVTIAGDNFIAPLQVLIGAVETTITANTATSIAITVPASASTGKITVNAAGGQVITLDSLTVTAPAPTVTDISSTSAHPGDTITIAGENLDDATVTIGGVEAVVIANTGTSITVTVPAGTEGGTVSVTTPGGTFGTSQQITVTPDSGESPVAFAAPAGIVVTAGGTPSIYVTDTTRHTVQVIASGTVRVLAGQANVSGMVDAGGTAARLNKPRGLSITNAGSLIVADSGNDRLRSITADGIVTTTGAIGPDAALAAPSGVSSYDGASGETYIADTQNHLIKKITAAGEVHIVAGSATSGTSNGALLSAQFNGPEGIAVDVSGSYLYVADTGNHVIRLVNLASGTVSTFAGQMAASGYIEGAALATARFNSPADLLVDADGDVYVADTGNSSIRLIASGGSLTVSTLAGGVQGFLDGTGTNARFSKPTAISMADDGSIYIADTGNGAIRRIAPDAAATVSTIQLQSGPPVSTGTSGTTPPPNPEPPGGKGGGGGGAVSLWFVFAMVILAAARLRRGGSC